MSGVILGEAIAGLSIGTAAMILVSTVLATSVALESRAWDLEREQFDRRQVWHLIERAAGNVAARPASSQTATIDCLPTLLRIRADLDGDGIINARSSETTSLEIRRKGSRTNLLHRTGRQAMTVLKDMETPVHLRCFTATGAEVAGQGGQRWLWATAWTRQ